MNKKRIAKAKQLKLNWQTIAIEECQTDLKEIVKRLLLDRTTYAQASLNINKQIKECVDMLESQELKNNAFYSLKTFAAKLLNESLLAMGVPQGSIILALDRYKNGQKTKQITAGLTHATMEEIKDVRQEKFIEDRRYAHTFEVGDIPVKNVGELGVANNEWGKIYMGRVKEALNRLIESEAKYDEHISLRNIAEMTVRYEGTLKRLQDLQDRGVNLIVTSRHENCSKRCEKWQGGHYTLDNTYQTVDGIQFIPLKVATDQYTVTKSGKRYKNGHLTGYNCRHYPMEYHTGVEPPMVDKATVERQRMIDKRMRELERLIRHWKEKVLMFENTEFTNELRNAKLKVKYWKTQYEQFCKANRRAIEPSRIQIF